MSVKGLRAGELKRFNVVLAAAVGHHVDDLTRALRCHPVTLFSRRIENAWRRHGETVGTPVTGPPPHRHAKPCLRKATRPTYGDGWEVYLADETVGAVWREGSGWAGEPTQTLSLLDARCRRETRLRDVAARQLLWDVQ